MVLVQVFLKSELLHDRTHRFISFQRAKACIQSICKVPESKCHEVVCLPSPLAKYASHHVERRVMHSISYVIRSDSSLEYMPRRSAKPCRARYEHVYIRVEQILNYRYMFGICECTVCISFFTSHEWRLEWLEILQTSKTGINSNRICA